MKRKIRIRPRLGRVICVAFPVIIIFMIGAIFEISPLKELSVICAIFLFPFQESLYNHFFYDSNTTCALYAGNLALEYGFSPKAQDGHIWNPDECKVSEVYSFYPNNRLPSPEPYTAGFMFYTHSNGTKSRHVEFYDYRAGGDTFVYFEFEFHRYAEFHDKTVRREMKISDIDSSKVFVKLEKL